MGIQIFDASEYLDIDKESLLKISSWQFAIIVDQGIIKIKIMLQVKVRNKIIERNPIIEQNIGLKLPNSEIICES